MEQLLTAARLLTLRLRHGFQLKHKGSDFVFNPLYSFISGDGTYPSARVIFGPNGTLYGTTHTDENGTAARSSI